jgi:1-acyl-sn-glycerol-3-phosphate acyltransferase
MNLLRVIVKTILVGSTVLAYLIIASFVALVVPNPDLNRKLRNRILEPMSALCLFFWGIRLTVKNKPRGPQTYLFVGNHVGFLDIFIISATVPTSFITSVDLRETPGMGWLARAGGCLFVERRSHNNIQSEIQNIRQVLSRGHNVVLYPEAKATDGAKIYPFKKSLMTSVVGTQVPILPMVLNYRRVNDEPMSHKFRDGISWWGDRSFFLCCYQAMSLVSIEAELEFLQPIQCKSEEQRREVAQLAQSQVEARYTQIPWPQDQIPEAAVKV